MTGAQAAPVVAVKVLVELDEIAPAGIALEELDVPVDRAPAIAVSQEDAREALRELLATSASVIIRPIPSGTPR
jgi:hypothetical protein